MNITWEKKTGQYQFGEWCRVGKVIVGDAGWRTGTKGEANNYGCACLLPGIKQSAEKYATLDEAKARLERMVRTWFQWIQDERHAND